jgi:hypothetical protein
MSHFSAPNHFPHTAAQEVSVPGIAGLPGGEMIRQADGDRDELLILSPR